MHYASMRYAALLKYNPPGLFQNITHSGETKREIILNSLGAGCCERSIRRPSADRLYASMRNAALLKYKQTVGKSTVCGRPCTKASGTNSSEQRRLTFRLVSFHELTTRNRGIETTGS